MNVFRLNKFRMPEQEILKVPVAFVLLVFIWPLIQKLVLFKDEMAGYIESGNLVLLILASLIGFLLMVGVAWWLLGRIWRALNLPRLEFMVLHFKEMLIWQQLGFYLALFALLLLAGVGCLAAIC